MTGCRPRLVIDWMPENGARYGPGWAVVAVDVFRATTTACTAVASGHRCFPVDSVEAAQAVAGRFDEALLAGELHGEPLPGFDLGNSPAAVAALPHPGPPIVLLSTSGTRLVQAASRASFCFLASLRNPTAQVAALADLGIPVAVIGAGTRGERRLEDRLGCARVAAGLLAAGFEADAATRAEAQALGPAPIERCLESPSAGFLRAVGHEADIEFVIGHEDDLSAAYYLADEEVVEFRG